MLNEDNAMHSFEQKCMCVANVIVVDVGNVL